MKMAQVEFITGLLVLFSKLLVEPICEPGVNIESARQNLLSLVEDRHIKLTLQLNNADQFRLRWL